LVCGAFKNVQIGSNTIEGAPDGLDLFRWDGTQAALQAGDLGMNTSSGRISLYVDGSAQDVALLSEAGGSGISLITDSSVSTYSTITAALAAASSGDIVRVGPGTYSESVTVPAGVKLQGGGFRTIIDGAAATGTRIALSNGSTVQDLTVELPTDAAYAINGPSGSSDEALCYNIRLEGQGGSGVGIRCQNGDLFLRNCFYNSGTADAAFQVTGGKMTAVMTYIWSGTLDYGWDIASGGTLIAETMGVQQGCVINECLVVEAAKAQIGRAVFLSGDIGIYVEGDGHELIVNSGRIESTSYCLAVDSATTSGLMNIMGVDMDRSKMDIPGTYMDNVPFLMLFGNAESGNEGMFCWSKLRVGSPEFARSCAFGQGPSTTHGMVVLTTDDTAAVGDDGDNFVDETAAASSSSGSTFTFQGKTAGYSILIGSTVTNTDGYVKYWGHKIKQTTASAADGVYIFEVWSGVSWQTVEMMVTDDDEHYEYGSNPFLRANSEEYIRLNLDENTTWATKSINGTMAYWLRVRITTSSTTAPVFEQWKMAFSHNDVGSTGLSTYHGLAQWSETLQATGNVFGEEGGGGVGDGSFSVGSGGAPSGWTHTIKNSRLNTNGDAIQYQFNLPQGVATQFPLYFKVTLRRTLVGSNTVTLIGSLLPVEVVAVEVADPTGGTTPTARTYANTDTLTTNAAQTDTVTTGSIGLVANTKVGMLTFGPFSIDDYYEDDLILWRLELDDDGVDNTDIDVLTVSVSGVKWTPGEKI